MAGMSRLIKGLSLLFVAATCASAAIPTEGSYVSFVTCPLVRDTPELPCWMAKEGSTLYYMGIQEGRTYKNTWITPQMMHQVLVEGVVSDGPRICGGIPLKELHASVLPEVSPQCNKMLPTEGYVSPKGRPVGPDPIPAPNDTTNGLPPVLYGQEDVAARRAVTFEAVYGFGSDFLMFPMQQNRVIQAVTYAKAINAGHIHIIAYRGSALLDNGQTMIEEPGVSAKRERNVRAILSALNIEPAIVTSVVRTEPEHAHGRGDFHTRRIEIEVAP